MKKSIPKIREREGNEKRHSRNSGTGREWKNPFPKFGNGNQRPPFLGMTGNGNSRSPLHFTPLHLKKYNNSLASLLDMHRCNELRPLPIKSPTKHLPRLQLHAIVQSLTKLADAEFIFHIYHVSAGQEYNLFHLNISTICSSLFDNYIMEESREKCFESKDLGYFSDSRHVAQQSFEKPRVPEMTKDNWDIHGKANK